MNPKDELKKKIVALANTMREYNEKTKEARKSVREQLKDIVDLGLNQRKMEKTELRKLLNEIFLYHGIHESWLRKLLPEGLKDESKTRLSYLQKQEIERERQRLLQQQQQETSESCNESILPDGSIAISATDEDLNKDTSSSSVLESKQESELEGRIQKDDVIVYEDQDTTIITPTNNVSAIKDVVQEASKKVVRLEAEVRRLSEPFVARASLRSLSKEVLVVAQIDPVEKVITSIQIDEPASI